MTTVKEIRLGRRFSLLDEILAAIGVGLVVGLSFLALHLR